MSTALFSFPIFRRAPTSSRPGMKTQERKARRLLSQKAEMFESFWSFSKNNQVFSGFSCKLSPQPGTGPNLVATHRGRENEMSWKVAPQDYMVVAISKEIHGRQNDPFRGR